MHYDQSPTDDTQARFQDAAAAATRWDKAILYGLIGLFIGIVITVVWSHRSRAMPPNLIQHEGVEIGDHGPPAPSSIIQEGGERIGDNVLTQETK